MTPAVVNDVKVDGPAYVAGIKKNDKIILIDGNKVESIMQVSTFISTSTSETIDFVVSRNDQEIVLNVKPIVVDGEDALGNKVKKRMIGISLIPYNNELNNVKLGPTAALYYSIKEVWFVCTTSIKYLGSMIIGSADSSQLGGPIRIAKISGQVA